MKRSICIAAIMLAIVVHHNGMAAILYTQGFNSVTIPADWATELVTNISASAITFVTASSYPAGFAPYEGTHFVKFNSYSYGPGASLRLKRTSSFSTLGYAGVLVQFAWTRDTGYASAADRVIVQYSTNGTTWIDAGTYQRYGSGSNYWEVNACALPPGAGNQPAVYLAFRFVSEYGYDCHLDDVKVLIVDSTPPDTFTATAVSTSQINLAWMPDVLGHAVIIASNGVNSFGLPTNGTIYNVGSTLPGGGGIIYKGTNTAFAHTGLLPFSLRYYRAWSLNAATQYSASVSASTFTYPPLVVAFPYFESFETGWGAWLPSPGYDFNWARIQGPPPDAGTGPRQAQDGSFYAYTESSSPNYPYKTAGLLAGFSFAGMMYPQLSFYYHMYGTYMGTLAVDVFDGTWHSNVWSLTGQQQTSATDLWRRADVPLTAYAFSNTMVQFRGVTGWIWLSDMGIDTIRVFDKVPNVYLTPELQTGVGIPGATVPYTLTIENTTPAARDFVFTYPSAWPVSGPAVTSEAIPAGGTTSLAVSVQIPADAVAGTVCTSTVRAISANNLYTNTALLLTRCTWTYEVFSEPFGVWPNGWTNYGTGGVTPWYQYASMGVPAPCAAHDPDPVPGSVSWLVSPPLNLNVTGPEQLLLSFYFAPLGAITNEGIYLSTGSRDPLVGDYFKLSDYTYRANAWTLNQLDFMPYKGNNPVYLAFRYVGMNPQQFVDTIRITGQKIGLSNAWLAAPPTFALSSYQSSPSVTGMLYITGETGPAGPAQNITAQFGYGATGTPPWGAWIWSAAPYVGASGSNDLFAGSAFITVAGPQDYAFRFRRGDAAWVYADFDGSTNGYQSAQAGKATVAPLPPRGDLLINQPILPAFSYGPASFAYPTNLALTYYEMADDVTLPYDACIKSLRWAGAYTTEGRKGLERGFWLRIYAESNSVPGTLLYEEFKQGYACEQTLLPPAPDGFLRCTYQSGLAAPFCISAGQRYWLSIQFEVATNTWWDLETFPAPISGSNAVQRNARAAPWTRTTYDIAVEIYGTATNAGCIAGTVTAAYSGAPIAGAGVRATNSMLSLAATSGTNGAYSLPLPPGTYTLLATAPNYVTGVAAGVAVALAGTNVQNVALIGSLLSYGPSAISARMQLGERVTNTVAMTNSGPLALNYQVFINDVSAFTNLTARTKPMTVAAALDSLIARSGVLGQPEQVAHVLAADAADYPGRKAPVFDVLICCADSPERVADVPANLLKSGLFKTVAVADVRVVTPTLPELQAFDAVLVYSNPRFGDAAAMGNVMADYVDAGGGVVAMMFELCTNNAGFVNQAMHGRWESGGYVAIPRDNFLASPQAFLGTVYVPEHPIMKGVSTFDGGSMSYRPVSNTVALGSVRIADWSDGKPLVVAREINGHRIVNLGFHPVSSNVYLPGGWNPATDGATLMANALAWAASSSAPWLSLSTSGSIAAGAAASFDVIFDAGAVANGGVYSAELTFAGSCVNSPPVLPLTMTIATGPIISAPSTLHFADTVISDARTQALAIANIGIGVLTGAVSGVSAPFGLAGTYFIPAGTNVQLTTLFAPLTEGAYTNAIALSGGGGAIVTLTGTGVPEPALLMLAATMLGMGARRRRAERQGHA